MKFIIAAALAAGLGFGFAGVANAAPAAEEFYGDMEYVPLDRDHVTHSHHPCLGQASGTAHHSCGTLTGGPSGGLF